MPDMDGAETFEKIKQINPNVKVMLSSGYSIDGKAGTLLAKGIREFVQKPFNITDLCDSVRKTLDD